VNPLDVVSGRAADRARLRKNDKVAKVAAEKGAQGLKSLDAKLKSAPVAAGNAGRARWRGIVRERLEPGEPPSSSNPHGARGRNVVGRGPE
jgi:hypothetical protein